MYARTIPIVPAGHSKDAVVRVPDHAQGRTDRLGAQVLDLPVPLRHRLLRDGVHGRQRLALRHRPLRRRAAALLAAPGRPADGGGHRHAQAGADPAEGVRADVRAQVGDGLRRVRHQRRLLPELRRAAGHRQDHPGGHLHPRLPAAARDGDRRHHAVAGQDRALEPPDHHRRASDRGRSAAVFDTLQQQLVPAAGPAAVSHGILVFDAGAGRVAARPCGGCATSSRFDIFLDVTAVDWLGQRRRASRSCTTSTRPRTRCACG